MPLIEVLAAMEQTGVLLDQKRLADIGEGFEQRIETLQADIFELAGHEFTIGSPQQLAEVLFDELGLTKKRRGKTGFSTDARVLSQIREEHEIVDQGRAVARAHQAEEHLPRRPPRADRPGHRPAPHHLQPDRHRHRPPLQHQPQPPEHPDPHRGGPPDPLLLRRAPRPPPALRRLQPDRAADPGPYRRRGRAPRDLRPRRGHSRRHRRRDPRLGSRRRSAPASAPRPRWSTTASPTVSPPTASPTASTSSRRRPPPTSTATSSASRRSSATSRRRSSSRRENGYVETLLGRRRPIPELRSGRPQVRGQGERNAVNMPIQGTSADIIKIAMVGCQRALDESDLETRLVLQIHDELLFEGPADEMEAASELVEREMCGAFELDPPLAVDVGDRQGLAGREVAALRGRSRRRAHRRARRPTAARTGPAKGRRRPAQ